MLIIHYLLPLWKIDFRVRKEVTLVLMGKLV